MVGETYIRGHPTPEEMRQIADYLQGTCKTVEDALTQTGQLHLEPHEDRILELLEQEDLCRCECCGWWVELSICDDFGVCEECQNDEG